MIQGAFPIKYRFGPFEADTASRDLRKNGVRLRLGEQSFQVLTALLERAGSEISRTELQQRIWPDGICVDFDKGLNSTVNKLRDALNDPASQPRYIETIPKRGYRFIARLDPEMQAPPVSLSEAAASTASSLPDPPSAVPDTARTGFIKRGWAAGDCPAVRGGVGTI